MSENLVSLPILPPIKLDKLRELEEIERELRAVLRQCLEIDGNIYNEPKALAYLRSYAIEIFDFYHAYFKEIEGYKDLWLYPIIVDTVVKLLSCSALECLQHGFNAMDRHKDLLTDTLMAHIKPLANSHLTLPAVPTSQIEMQITSATEIVSAEAVERSRRDQLLADYKSATSSPSNRRIYESRNAGIHKPEFYRWIKGTLPRQSETAQNFERFLREKKQPIPRNLKA